MIGCLPLHEGTRGSVLHALFKSMASGEEVIKTATSRGDISLKIKLVHNNRVFNQIPELFGERHSDYANTKDQRNLLRTTRYAVTASDAWRFFFSTCCTISASRRGT